VNPGAREGKTVPASYRTLYIIRYYEGDNIDIVGFLAAD